MSTKRIVFTSPDGGVTVVHPAYNDPVTGKKADETEEAYLARVIARNLETGTLPKDAVFKIVEGADLPSRTYRNAWRFDGVAVAHDMAVARQIKLDEKIRPERNKRLAALDVEYMRADEAGDAEAKAAIADKKKTLRDVPATIAPALDAVTDPDALAAWQPEWPPP